MASKPMQEPEYIPVDQAAGSPQVGRAQFYPKRSDAPGAQAKVTLYGIRDSDVFSIELTVTAPNGLQAINDLMSAIREAKRVYALSPIQPVTKPAQPIE